MIKKNAVVTSIFSFKEEVLKDEQSAAREYD